MAPNRSALPRLAVPTIVPTGRALALLAALAPLALLVAASAPSGWVLAPAFGLALLLALLVDGWRAGRMEDLRFEAVEEVEIGQPFALRLSARIDRPADAAPPEAAIGFTPRLGAGGAVCFALSPCGQRGCFAGEGETRAVRRGTGTIETAWLRWRGPLGLATRQARRRLDRPVRVSPDLSPVRSPPLQAFFRDGELGLAARRIRGEGTQFEALRDYEPGMDRRRIDWKASARHTGLLAREHETERDNQIVFAFDCGQAMCESVDGLPRIDRAVSAALTAAFVALRGGDRVALFGFAERPQVMTPFLAGTRSFHRLQAAAAQLDYTPREANFTLALATLAERLHRRSLIVLFADFGDTTSAELMVESVERLMRHHRMIFVTLTDTDLADLAATPPDSLGDIALAVGADALARQRALVLARLRRLGVDVIEAPHETIGYRLIDRYLETKSRGTIG